MKIHQIAAEIAENIFDEFQENVPSYVRDRLQFFKQNENNLFAYGGGGMWDRAVSQLPKECRTIVDDCENEALQDELNQLVQKNLRYNYEKLISSFEEKYVY